MMEGSSTGLFLLMNDNKVYNSVFFCSMRGIFNGGSVNWFEDIHMYTAWAPHPFGGIYTPSGVHNTRLEGVYFGARCPHAVLLAIFLSHNIMPCFQMAPRFTSTIPPRF